MALIGTIRKNFWFVLILLGLALIAFLFMDIFGSNVGGGSAGAGPALGKVGSTTINYNDFRRAEASLFRGSQTNQFAVKNSLWDFFVEKAIVEDEAKALGVGISKEELRDLEFGPNPHPMFQSIFRNPQTGQMNLQQQSEIKQAIENDEFTNLEFRTYWTETEHQVIKEATQSKLNAMVSKAMYTPTWMVKKVNQQNTTLVNFDYVKVPFDHIADSEVEVTDAAISSYLKNNAAKYTNDQESRRAEFVVFDVIASAQDSMNVLDETNKQIAEFIETKDDSLFALNRSGNFFNYFARASELPEAMQGPIANMSVGQVHGPYVENGFYTAFKLVDKQVLPDSVKTKHILRTVAQGDLIALTAAQTLVDSILTELKAGRANFGDMAEKFSQDPGSSSKGGDMGYMAQGSLLPEMNEVIFFEKEGTLKSITTQAGIHIMSVGRKKYNDRNPKYKTGIIRFPIVPSQDTQDELFSEATELVSANKSIDALKTAIQGKSKSTQLSAFLKSTDFIVGDLGGDDASREIVKWLFDSDSDVGEVSAEIYTYSDPNLYFDNKYVLAGLNAVNAKGLQSAEAARGSVEFLVRNQMKGDKIIAQKSGSDLNALASQFGQTVANIDNANINSTNLTGLGNEPKVVSAALAGNLNSMGEAIVGNSGVYFVVPTSKTEGSAQAANVPSLRATKTRTDRARVGTGLVDALKKTVKIQDSRLSLDI